MPSRAELEEQNRIAEAIVALAWQQLQAGWVDLGVTSANVTTQTVLHAVADMLVDLLEVWGDAAATSAADFFDEMRDRAGIRGTFTAELAEPPSRDQVLGSVRWALDPNPQRVGGELPPELDVERMLGKLQGPLQRLIRQTGRTTVDQAVLRDPARPRVARVPLGAETCGFCLVLASRGPVYRSVGSAGHDTNYHDFDDCEQVVVWTPDDELPEGYDPGELYGKYEAARAAAGSSDLRRILRELRQLEGVR